MTSTFDDLPDNIIVDIMKLVIWYRDGVDQRTRCFVSYKNLINLGATCKRMRRILHYTTSTAMDIWSGFDPSIFGSEVWSRFGRRGTKCTIPRSVTTNITNCGFIKNIDIYHLTPKIVAAMSNLKSFCFVIPPMMFMTGARLSHICSILKAIIENPSIESLTIRMVDCLWDLVIEGRANLIQAMIFLIGHDGDVNKVFYEASRAYNTPMTCRDTAYRNVLMVHTAYSGTSVAKQPHTKLPSFMMVFDIYASSTIECIAQFADIIRTPKYSTPDGLVVNIHGDTTDRPDKLPQIGVLQGLVRALASSTMSTTITKLIWESHDYNEARDFVTDKDLEVFGAIIDACPNVTELTFAQNPNWIDGLIRVNSTHFSRIQQLTVLGFAQQHVPLLRHFPNLQKLTVDNSLLCDDWFELDGITDFAGIKDMCPQLESYNYALRITNSKSAVINYEKHVPRPINFPSEVVYVLNPNSELCVISDDAYTY